VKAKGFLPSIYLVSNKDTYLGKQHQQKDSVLTSVEINFVCR